MANKVSNKYDPTRHRIKKRTSIGAGTLSRPNNKHKRRNFKKYRGQGRPQMSYVITQSDTIFVKDLDEIDIMTDPDTEEASCFETYEEAAMYLMYMGVRQLSGSFPFNINIARLQ